MGSIFCRFTPPKKPRIHPRLFAVRNSPLCGGAARLTAEPVTSSLLTLTERRRAAFPSEFSLTLRRTAPFVRIPLISPVCAFAFPFAVPSSLRSSLRVQLFPPKKPRIHPRLFAVRNSPLCGAAAARLTAEPVTPSLLTLTERRCSAFPFGFSVGSPPCGSVGATALRPVCATVCLSVRYSVLAPLVLTSPVVSTKKAEDTPSAFCCPQQSSVRRCHTPYGVTSDFVTADAHGKASGGIPVRLFRWLSAVRLRRCDCLTSRLCNRLPFRSLFRPRSARPYESSCFHQKSRGYTLGFLLSATVLCAAVPPHALRRNQ